MKRKIISVLLCILLLASLLPVSAFADTTASGTCGANLTWTLDSDGTLTISGTGAMYDWIYDYNFKTTAPWRAYLSAITTLVVESGVTSVGRHAFEGCSNLMNVTVPDSVTSIGDYAFRNCSNLTSARIPDGVTNIGDSVFNGCSSLTSARIPDSVTSIGDYAFYDCSSLTSVTIPDSVTNIGSSAFSGCGSLTSVTIGNSVTSIGSGAFYGCSNIKNVHYNGDIESWLGIEFASWSSNPCSNGSNLYFNGELVTYVVIHGSVTSIGSYTFYGCRSLASVTIPDSVTSIGDYAFYECSSLTSVSIPDGVTSIGDYAFYDCSSLTNMTIPDSVTSIGSHVFCGCSSLTSVTIPDGVTIIEDRAFYGCSSLASVTIPDGVTSIESNAFNWCSKLRDIVFGGTKEAWAAIGYTPSSNTRMHYNCKTLDGHYVPIEKNEPSCTSAGYIKYGCNCGCEYKETLSKVHDYVFVGSFEPTCAVHGYDLYRCSKCGAENKEYKNDDLKEHSYVMTIVEPTCTTGGYTLHKCSVCGGEYKDDLTALLGHSMVSVGEKAPTCTEAGHTAGVQCSRCGTVDSGMTEIEALGHNHGAWTQTKAPTCTAKGSEVRTCTRCNEAQTRAVDSLGHDYKNGSCTRCGEKDPNYIAAPVIKITTSAGKPKISWAAVDGAAKYKVFYSADGKKYKQLIETTKTSVTHTGAKIGTTYYYKVKAVNADGAMSAFSNGKNIKCVPAAPTVTISRSGGKAKLSWKKVSGATKYWVYRSTDGKKYTRVAIATKLTYTDSKSKSGTKYYYKVRAIAVVNNTNVGSAYSTAKSITTTLAKPTVKITTSNGKPKLTWSKVTGADKYYIYRSTDGKTFKYYTSTTKLTYTNTGAKKNTKYYYKVKAICSSSTAANSAYSAVVSIKATK